MGLVTGVWDRGRIKEEVKGRWWVGLPSPPARSGALIPPRSSWQSRPRLQRWICSRTAAVSMEELIGPYLAVPFIFIFYQLPSIICVLSWIWELILSGLASSASCKFPLVEGVKKLFKKKTQQKNPKTLIMASQKESIGNYITWKTWKRVRKNSEKRTSNNCWYNSSSCLQM